MKNKQKQAIIARLEIAKKDYTICRLFFWLPFFDWFFDCQFGFCFYFYKKKFTGQIIDELQKDKIEKNIKNRDYWYKVNFLSFTKLDDRLQNINRTLNRLKNED